MATENVIELTDSEFDQTIANASEPVLVDFWAEWCGPCRHIGPAVDELADAYKGRLTVAKVNVDEHQQAAQKYGVQSIPTLLVFKNGDLVDRIVGAVPKQQLEAAIQKAM